MKNSQMDLLTIAKISSNPSEAVCERERERKQGIPDFSIAKVNVGLQVCEVVGQTCSQQCEGKACLLEKGLGPMTPKS